MKRSKRIPPARSVFRFGILVALTGLVVAHATAVPPMTVRSGHDGAVTNLVYRPDDQTLLTTGADGKLLAWDTDSGRLLQSIRADQLPIRYAAVYPDGERVALYSSDGRRHRITVWNWRTGERVFLHSPGDQVLSLSVSPQSSYVFYTTPSLQSVRVLDAGTGRPLPFLRRNTGIVSWTVVATSEERVMTYAPATGEINYRAIVTGSSAASFDGPEELTLLTLLEARRFAAARTADGRLTVIDLLSGAQMDTVAAGDIEQIFLDQGNGDIVVLSASYGGRRTIRRYRFQDNELQSRYATRREIPVGVTPVQLAGRGLFGGRSDGTLMRWLPFESRPVTFAQPILERVTDLHIADGQLHMLSAQRVISIASDFFDDQSTGTTRQNRTTSYLRQQVVDLPTGLRSSFVPTGTDDLLVWTPESTAGKIQSYTIGGRTLNPQNIPVPPGLIAVDAYQDEILMLNRSGTLELRDRFNGDLLLDYRGRGLQTAVRTPRGVFVGRAAEGVIGSSVLRLNARTGETVPLETESDLAFYLHFDSRRGRLFAIGVRTAADGEIFTIVEVFEGPNLDRRRTILEIPGEYLDATLVHDPVTGTAYTTLDDRGGILRWDGSRTTELLRNPAHIPRRIYLDGNLLYSINRDGTISVVNRFDGEQLVDFYVIADTGGSWLALRPDGRYFASADSLATEENLSLNIPDGTLADRRLAIGETPPTPDRPSQPQRDEEDAEADSSEDPIHRFDSGQDPDDEPTTPEMFDPFSGEPAPSS